MNLKAALSNNDRKVILNSCKFGENIAVNIYNKNLKNKAKYLATNQQAILKAQYLLIKTDHDKVKSLRDML